MATCPLEKFVEVNGHADLSKNTQAISRKLILRQPFKSVADVTAAAAIAAAAAAAAALHSSTLDAERS